MDSIERISDAERYARIVEGAKRTAWDVEADVIRGRRFEPDAKFLPDGLALAGAFTTLSDAEKRFVSRIQGRTYANVFGMVERFIVAKVLELGRDRGLGDQTELEALVRFGEEELKHQVLFRRIEALAAEAMPPGYRFGADPDAVARAVLDKSDWAVLALTLDIELFTQLHYRDSIEPDAELSELYKDVFLHHWKEESRHAVLDEMEWRRCDAALSAEERDRAVDEFIELIAAVNAVLEAQAAADAGYFAAACGRPAGAEEARRIEAAFLKAYRRQYVHSGAENPRFLRTLGAMIDADQAGRIRAALAVLR